MVWNHGWGLYTKRPAHGASANRSGRSDFLPTDGGDTGVSQERRAERGAAIKAVWGWEGVSTAVSAPGCARFFPTAAQAVPYRRVGLAEERLGGSVG